MNNNIVRNSKVEVPNTAQMNDKDYLTSIFTIEKAMVKDYAVAITEASNQDLYSNYHEMFDEASDLQREIYNMMFKKGWYTLEMAEETKITNKFNTLSQELPQLENNGYSSVKSR